MFLSCGSILVSCQNDDILLSSVNEEIFNPDDPKYDENNYSFNTINLWGSEAAVVDKGDHYVFQGDIFLAKEDLDSVQTRGAAILNRSWPNNKVYYSTEGITSQVYLNSIQKAIERIENGSYIDMEERNGQSDYIQFLSADLGRTIIGSSDYIGRKGGKQTLTMNEGYLNSVGTITHEICHHLGMFHEQCRTDRDNYIRINFEGMSEIDRAQYKKYSEQGYTGVDVGTFDFGSIMLYSSNGCMTKLDGSTFVGQRDSLSYTDMRTLALLQPISQFKFFDPAGYNPPYNSDYEYRRTKSLQCPEGANLDFKFQYKYNPTSLGGYSIEDFDVRTIISITNRLSGREVYHTEIPLSQSPTWTESYIRNVNIPQGGFNVSVTLKGSVKGTSSALKLLVLKSLMYTPMVYLYLDKAIINGVQKPIPNDVGNPDRNDTFISIV